MKRDDSASLGSDWGRILGGRKRRLRAFFLSWWLVKMRTSRGRKKCPQQCQSRRFAGTGKVARKKYILPQKTRGKRPFVFFSSLRRTQRLERAGKRCGRKLQGQLAQSALLARRGTLLHRSLGSKDRVSVKRLAPKP